MGVAKVLITVVQMKFGICNIMYSKGYKRLMQCSVRIVSKPGQYRSKLLVVAI